MCDASRDPSKYTAIVAVTFSGFVRDVLSDLVHHDITRLVAHAGDRRNAPQVFLKKLERFCELRGLTVPELVAQLTEKGHSEDAVSSTISRNAVDTKVMASISDILVVPDTEFEVLQLESDEEVTYVWFSDHPVNGSWKNALASCKHQTEAGGYNWMLRGEEAYTSKSFSYIYNYGDAPLNISWGMTVP